MPGVGTNLCKLGMITVTAFVVPFRFPVRLYLVVCPRLALSGLNIDICPMQMCSCWADVTLRTTSASQPHRGLGDAAEDGGTDLSEPTLLVGSDRPLEQGHWLYGCLMHFPISTAA